MKRPTGSTRGFTLIELLVVISIIALLVGILLPALAAARDVAKLTSCSVQVRQIATAVISYAADEDGELPPSVAERTISGQWTNPFVMSYASSANETYVSAYLGTYLKESRNFDCPYHETSNQSALDDRLRTGYEEQTNPNALGSYSLLWNYSQWDSRVVSDTAASQGEFVAPQRLGDVQADQLLLQDVVTEFVGNWYSVTHPDRSKPTEDTANGNPYYTLRSPEVPSNSMPVNAGYVDGHVESVQFQNLNENTLPWLSILKVYTADKQ